MFKKRYTKFVWAYVSLLVIVLVAVAASSKPVSASVCEQAVQWVKNNEENLPQNLDDFLVVPVEYQRVVFAALPAETKGKMWITHLERYLTNHDDLSADQISVIKEAIGLIEQSNIYVASSDSLQQYLVALNERAVATFGEREATLIFAQLGSDSQQSTSAGVGYCKCSTEDDWCWGGKRCMNRLDCISQESGCGTLWQYKCDGLCRTWPPR